MITADKVFAQMLPRILVNLHGDDVDFRLQTAVVDMDDAYDYSTSVHIVEVYLDFRADSDGLFNIRTSDVIGVLDEPSFNFFRRGNGDYGIVIRGAYEYMHDSDWCMVPVVIQYRSNANAPVKPPPMSTRAELRRMIDLG